MPRRLSETQALGALFFFALAVLLPGAGSPSQLTRGDVYTYVLRVVVGFLERGDWLVPHMGGAADFTKPPLFHWVLALCVKALPNPFLAVRLPPILCSAATALLVFDAGRRLGLDLERRLAAAFMWLGSSAMLAYGRQPLLEAPLALTMLAAFCALERACTDERPAWLYVFGAALGLSSMVKWIVGPLTIGLFAAFYLAASGKWRWLLSRPGHAAGAVLLSGALALPWPLFALASHTELFLHQLRHDLFHDRYAQHTPLAAFFGRGVLLALAPWTLLLLPAAAGLGKLDRPSRVFLGSWLAAVFVPCMLITARTSRYAFPAVPALALAAAAAWRPERLDSRLALRATAAVLLAVYGLVFGACMRLGVAGPALASLGLGLAGAAAVLAWKERLAAAAAVSCLASAVLGGPAMSAFGMNVIPAAALSAVGDRPVGRFINDPQSASTGYLQLYLKRNVELVYIDGVKPAFDQGMLLVASGTELERLKEEAAKDGLKVRVLETWLSPHTNPLPEAVRDALRTASAAPLQVRHSLVSLER